MNLDFGDRIDARNLIAANVSYTTSTTLRAYNQQANGDDSTTQFAFLGNRNNPTNGTCYAATGGPARPVSCYDTANVTALTLEKPNAPNVSGLTCGGGPCAFYVARRRERSGRYVRSSRAELSFNRSPLISTISFKL